MTKTRYAMIAAAALATGVGISAPVHTSAASATAKAHAVKAIQATTVNGTFAFSPKKVTIKVGTKVVWTNPSAAPHTVTGKGHWKLNKQLPQGGKVTVVFKKVGTYHYYCAIHPFMLGTIVVKK